METQHHLASVYLSESFAGPQYFDFHFVTVLFGLLGTAAEDY